jgi:hypothetical protein
MDLFSCNAASLSSWICFSVNWIWVRTIESSRISSEFLIPAETGMALFSPQHTLAAALS